ncbi:unnamed protein product [Fraxinus pennsylvanica]|uniref:protein-serine/threonine phosphatase n=1 Tax=Fraxinus pennsylvanica TaxID=56036 RepID=A0AAD1Z2J8_9LAMI|nr:unnamed protein product [Fraxinus pennsylvanica]
MFSWLGRIASACLRPLGRYVLMNKDDNDSLGGEDDALLWCKDLEKHSHGEFSFAVVQANEFLEDQSQVETGHHATFVGVYDGHGGPEASRFICDHLFQNLIRLARESGTISEDILRNAFSETEDGFLTLVRRAYEIKPLIAAIGSCCLVGVIWEVMKQGVWRVKGIIQVSRSIGDAYLKRPEFALDPSFPRFHLHEPLCRPVLRSDPSICKRVLQPNDKFIIFASDGLWEYLTNQDAVEIVHNNPRMGVARRILISAMKQACKKRQMTYNQLKKFDKGDRRNFHDDITVVIIFIDHAMLENKGSLPELSVRGFVDTVGPSNFNFPQGIDANTKSPI